MPDLHGHRTNAGLAWALVGLAGLLAAVDAVRGDPRWLGFVAAVLAVTAVPAARLRDPLAVPPWEVLGLATVPPVVAALGIGDPVLGTATYLAVAALALLVAAQLHAFADATLSLPFAVGFVTATTMAVAGLWTVARYLAGLVLGRDLLPAEDPLMWSLLGATGAGLLAAAAFQIYLDDAVTSLRWVAGADDGSGGSRDQNRDQDQDQAGDAAAGPNRGGAP